MPVVSLFISPSYRTRSTGVYSVQRELEFGEGTLPGRSQKSIWVTRRLRTCWPRLGRLRFSRACPETRRVVVKSDSPHRHLAPFGAVASPTQPLNVVRLRSPALGDRDEMVEREIEASIRRDLTSLPCGRLLDDAF